MTLESDTWVDAVDSNPITSGQLQMRYLSIETFFNPRTVFLFSMLSSSCHRKSLDPTFVITILIAEMSSCHDTYRFKFSHKPLWVRWSNDGLTGDIIIPGIGLDLFSTINHRGDLSSKHRRLCSLYCSLMLNRFVTGIITFWYRYVTLYMLYGWSGLNVIFLFLSSTVSWRTWFCSTRCLHESWS